MPAYPASAIVVHRTNLGEADRLLTLYTREVGKVSAVAKGARRSRSRLSGMTELFTASRLLLASGRNLDIVSQAEIRESFPNLRMDLPRLARATYLCELLDRMTESHDASQSEELYDLTLSALTLLGRGDLWLDAIVHAYELRLLALQGYSPVLDHCVLCGGALGARAGGYSPSLGGALCASDRFGAEDAVPLATDSLQLLELLLHAEPEALLSLSPSRKVAAEIGKALRWTVRLRAHRSLKSADFLDQLRQSNDA